MAASSSSISIATSSNSASTFPLYKKNLSLQNPLISIKTHLKTHKFTLRFKTIYSDLSPLFRSSIVSPNCSQLDGVAQVIENPESELSENEEQQKQLDGLAQVIENPESELSENEEEQQKQLDGVAQVIENPESELSENEEEQQKEELEEDDKKEEESESEPVDAQRLYVGNMPFSVTSGELTDIFSQAGTVLSVELVYNKVTGRSRGFAFIVMGSAQEAKEAIRLLDGSQLGGRNLKVNFPEVPKGGERKVMEPKIRTSQLKFVESPNKLYAGNLSWIVTSEKLREAFAEQPGLLSAKVIYDKDSGKSRGFGFITFDSREAVESALSTMNGVGLEGRPLRLNFAGERADMSRPSREISSSEIELDERETISSDSN